MFHCLHHTLIPHPTVSQLLDALASQTECTITECHEPTPLLAPSHNAPNAYLAACTAFVLLVGMLYTARGSRTSSRKSA